MSETTGSWIEDKTDDDAPGEIVAGAFVYGEDVADAPGVRRSIVVVPS